MEKQLALFDTGQNDDLSIWSELPDKVRQEVDTLLAQLILQPICGYLKEVLKDEK